MTKPHTFKRYIRTVLWIGFTAAAALIAGCSTGTGSDMTPGTRVLPTIDTVQPAQFETATFAMG